MFLLIYRYGPDAKGPNPEQPPQRGSCLRLPPPAPADAPEERDERARDVVLLGLEGDRSLAVARLLSVLAEARVVAALDDLPPGAGGQELVAVAHEARRLPGAAVEDRS